MMSFLWSSCLRKRQYVTIAAAQEGLDALLAKGEYGLHVYRCDLGNHWHVGHKKGKK